MEIELRIFRERTPQTELPEWEDKAYYSERLQFRVIPDFGVTDSRLTKEECWSPWADVKIVEDDAKWKASIKC